MLAMIDADNQLLGRALMWTTECGTKLLDRIYYTNEDVQQAFMQWVKDNNYVRKEYQSHDCRHKWIKPTGESYTENYSVALKENNYDYYPYSDTFTYLTDGVLECTKENCDGDSYKLISLNGGYEHVQCSAYCPNCSSERSNDDELCYSDYLGETFCPDCSEYSSRESDNVPTTDDRGVYSEAEGEYIFRDNSIYSEDVCQYFHNSSDYFVYRKSNDCWYHVNNVVHCEYKDDVAPHEQVVHSNWENDNLLTADATEVTLADGTTDWILTSNSVFSRLLGKHLVEANAIEVDVNGNIDYVYTVEVQATINFEDAQLNN